MFTGRLNSHTELTPNTHLFKRKVVGRSPRSCLRYSFTDGRIDTGLLLDAEDELACHLATPLLEPTLQRSQLAVGIDVRVLML